MNRKTIVMIFALFIAFAMPSALCQDQEKSKKEKPPKRGKRPALVAPEKQRPDAAQPAVVKGLMERLDRQAKALKALTGEVKNLKVQLGTMKKALARRSQAQNRKAGQSGGDEDNARPRKEMRRKARSGQDRASAQGSAQKPRRSLQDRKEVPKLRARKAIGERLRAAQPDRAQKRRVDRPDSQDKRKLQSRATPPARRGQEGGPERAARLRDLKKRIRNNPELQRRLRERVIERRR